MRREIITIVSGLPRSGTSMMMKMLEAGGMQVLTDDMRTADEDNPKGYYEFEMVKQIERNHLWLQDAKGKAVKIVSSLLGHLPKDHAYKLIFMRRNMEEILASQRKMLVRRGEPVDTISDEEMTKLFRQHLKRIEAWIKGQSNIEIIYVSYNEILENPFEQAEKVNQFLGKVLNVEEMAGTVDTKLYRQRR